MRRTSKSAPPLSTLKTPEVIGYFDGGFPFVKFERVATYGCWLSVGGKIVWEDYGDVVSGTMATSNVAEYGGFMALLGHLLELKWHSRRILIRGDSQLVVKQMNGEWGARPGKPYLMFYENALELRRQFRALRAEWIPREENGYADKLAARARSELEKPKLGF